MCIFPLLQFMLLQIDPPTYIEIPFPSIQSLEESEPLQIIHNILLMVKWRTPGLLYPPDYITKQIPL